MYVPGVVGGTPTGEYCADVVRRRNSIQITPTTSARISTVPHGK